MIVLPVFNPDLLVIAGVIRIKWYGFMYLLGFLIAWIMAIHRLKGTGITKERLLDYFSAFALGIIVGGRFGYMLIYNYEALITSPLTLFKIWNGGMSFHGALIGGVIATVVFSLKYAINVHRLIDFTVPLLPPGIMLGRFGNFINGELWGRVTNVSWAMIFPYSDGLPRHPSQLYEMLGEGVLLYFLMDWHRKRNQFGSGMMGCWFLIHYGWIRFALEFFREPDVQIGYVWFDFLSMGQCLCLVMLISGFVWFMKRDRQLNRAVLHSIDLQRH